MLEPDKGGGVTTLKGPNATGSTGPYALKCLVLTLCEVHGDFLKRTKASQEKANLETRQECELCRTTDQGSSSNFASSEPHLGQGHNPCGPQGPHGDSHAVNYRTIRVKCVELSLLARCGGRGAS